jgi:hypothetical protein
MCLGENLRTGVAEVRGKGRAELPQPAKLKENSDGHIPKPVSCFGGGPDVRTERESQARGNRTDFVLCRVAGLPFIG